MLQPVLAPRRVLASLRRLARGGPLSAALLAAAAPGAGLAAALAALEAPLALTAPLTLLGLTGAAAGAAAAARAERAMTAHLERLAPFAAPEDPARPRALPERVALGIEAMDAKLRAALERGEAGRLDDPLTGLPNRLSAMRRARDEITRARRKDAPLAAGLVDVQAEAGPTGPTTLRIAAETLCQQLRAYDLVARWDETRFAVVLPEAEVEHAVAALQRSAAAFAAAAPVPAALRAGVAVLQPEDATLADLVARAEAALGRALSPSGREIEAAPGPRLRPASLTLV